jgi:HEAT repeat protein
VLGVLLLALLLGGAALAWTERATLLAWYCVHGLAHAGEGDRARWVERVAGLGEPAVPALLDCLEGPDEAVCANARAGLARLADDWGPADGRTVALTVQAAHRFPHLSAAGQRAVLEMAAGWFAAPAPADGLVPACGRLLAASAGAAGPEALRAGLDLCSVLLAQSRRAEALGAAREAVRAGLRGGEAANRLRAVRLALQPGMDLLEDVVALLNDPAPEVRRAAMLAVGPADQVVRDEGLLPSLHDSDAEVRRLCEAALRGRGLKPEHLKLGRALTDPRPAVRLRVLDLLGGPEARDLDRGLWLRRLSHDPSPHVRFAAMRAASEGGLADLTDRLEQMGRSDPSPTVSKWAPFYLQRLKSRSAAVER